MPTYDVDTLALFDSREPDIASLGDVDVVVNLISDADQAEAMLPAAARLAEKLGKPVVNAPGKILAHDARCGGRSAAGHPCLPRSPDPAPRCRH